MDIKVCDRCGSKIEDKQSLFLDRWCIVIRRSAIAGSAIGETIANYFDNVLGCNKSNSRFELCCTCAREFDRFMNDGHNTNFKSKTEDEEE